MNNAAKSDAGRPVEPGDVALPDGVDRASFQTELDRLRIREKAHTHEGDAIAAALDEFWGMSPAEIRASRTAKFLNIGRKI